MKKFFHIFAFLFLMLFPSSHNVQIILGEEKEEVFFNAKETYLNVNRYHLEKFQVVFI